MPIFTLFAEFINKNFLGGNGIGSIVQTAFDIILGSVNTVVDIFKTLVTWIEKALDAMSKFFTKSASLPKTISGVSGSGFGVTGVSSIVSGQRAFGGSVDAGKSYLVGERGAEMFTPSTSGTVGGAGGNITINVNGSRNPDLTADAIVRKLKQQNINNR